jgi:hypothetical protein
MSLLRTPQNRLDSWDLPAKALIWLAAIPIGFLGQMWLYVFLFTEYRSHQQPLGIFAGAIAVLLAIGLARLNTAAIFLLLLGMVSVFLFSMALFAVNLSAAVFYGLISGAYCWFLGKGLFKL